MDKNQPALLLVVLLLATLAVPAGSATSHSGCEPVIGSETPQVAGRNGTPLVVVLQLAPCAVQEHKEIRAWLGNATHQASRVYDGEKWTTSQHYVQLDHLNKDDGRHLLPLQANPDSTHASGLIEETGQTTAWIRLRGDNTTQPISLGTLQWVDEDHVVPYWGEPGRAWLAVYDDTGKLMGSTLQRVDKNGDHQPSSFAYIALNSNAPPSPGPPVAPGDLLIARMGPRLHGGGSLIELVVQGDIHDLGGVRLESRSGAIALGPMEVTPGTLVRLSDDWDDAVAPLEAHVPHGEWNAPRRVGWGEENAADDVDQTAETDGRFQFARSGGSLRVVYGDVILDEFAYGNTPAPKSWHGEAMEATRIDGRIYLRGHDGDRFTDTNTQDDWQRPRIHRQHQIDLETQWFQVEGPVRAWVCPDRCHEEPILRINEAETSIDANLYELTLPSATQALAAAAERGVQVRVLVHDRPVGASASRMDQVAWSIDRLLDAGAQVRTLDGGRYDVNHAKYLVVDETWTVVTTENAGASGWPPDGKSGNRGHGVAVYDPALAHWTTTLFETDHEHPSDARNITGQDLHPDAQRIHYPQNMLEPPPAKGKRIPTLVVDGPFPVAPVLAPDHLGDAHRNPIAATLNDAREVIGLAQMNLPLSWSRPGHTQESPLALALVEAAGNNVSVTGTLASAFIEDTKQDNNHKTAAALHSTNHRIDLRLGGAPSPEGVVHAKTWWTDPGTPHAVAITGSANGNLASQAMNRELDLLLSHPEIADYWATIAARDHEQAQGFAAFAPQQEDEKEPQQQGESPLAPPVVLVFVLALSIHRMRRKNRTA